MQGKMTTMNLCTTQHNCGNGDKPDCNVVPRKVRHIKA